MFVHKTALLSAITTALLASASLQAAEPLKAVGAGEDVSNDNARLEGLFASKPVPTGSCLQR